MGNPFVDAGVCGICEWLGRNVQPEQITKDDLEKIVTDIAPIMQVEAGWKILYGIFPNGVLTNPGYSKCKTAKCKMPNKCQKIDTSFSKCNRVELLKKECQDYLNSLCDLGQSGTCIGCGRRAANNLLSRTHVPLTGAEHSNYFSFFAEGVGYCSACAFAVQFSPFSFVETGGKLLMLHSNSWEMQRIWSTICINGIKRQHAQERFWRCYKPSNYTKPRNVLFEMISLMLSENEDFEIDENEVVSMQVYSFTNNNQNPDSEIFYVSSSVFKFLYYTQDNSYKEAWNEIVRKGYQKVNWSRVKSEEDYKNKVNLVFEYLLQDRSIRGFFLDRHDQKPRGNWELLALYLKEVRGMKTARIEKIKQVGDLIAESVRKSGKRGVRRLQDFANANTYAVCRSVLLRIFEDRIYEHKEPEPLFSFEDCVEYIFISADDALSWSDEVDDGELDDEQKEQLIHSINDNVRFWRETRDLLLFRIYEILHPWLTEQEDN